MKEAFTEDDLMSEERMKAAIHRMIVKDYERLHNRIVEALRELNLNYLPMNQVLATIDDVMKREVKR